MDIQFNHRVYEAIRGGKTFALQLPTKEEFLQLIENETRSIVLPLGVAHCSPKDNYSKHQGRELSKGRLANLEFRVSSIHFGQNGDMEFFLIPKEPNDTCKLIKLKMSNRSSRIYFVYAY